MKYREVAKKLKKMGCEETSKPTRGFHRKWTNPKTGKGTIVPDQGSSDLPTGTVRTIVRQLGIDWKEFKKAK